MCVCVCVCVCYFTFSGINIKLCLMYIKHNLICIYVLYNSQPLPAVAATILQTLARVCVTGWTAGSPRGIRQTGRARSPYSIHRGKSN